MHRWKKNACSFLYAVCARVSREMGYRTILTYILHTEDGASLRASGWICGGERGGGNWNVPSRPRKDSETPIKKLIYTKELRQ